jgi:hypothetical protein
MGFGEIEQLYSALNFLVMIPYVAISVLFPFGLIYILGFLRGRDGNKDPLLGAKVISCLLLTLSMHILLMGATGLLEIFLDKLGGNDIRDQRGGINHQLRTSLALCVSALACGSYAFAALFRASKTGDGQVFRQASGLNAISTGIVTVVTLTLLLVLIFNKAKMAALSPMYATTITYGASHILCMIPMFHDWRRVKGDGEDSLLITKQDLSAQAADTDVETPVVPGSDP